MTMLFPTTWRRDATNIDMVEIMTSPHGSAENAGVENAENSRGGECKSGKSRSRSHGWKMQEWKIHGRKRMETGKPSKLK